MFHFILCCNENVINWIPLWNSICFRIFFFFLLLIPHLNLFDSDSIRFRIFDLLDVLIFRLRIKKVCGKGERWRKGQSFMDFAEYGFTQENFLIFIRILYCVRQLYCASESTRSRSVAFFSFHAFLSTLYIYTLQRNQFIKKKYFSSRINIIFFLANDINCLEATWC